MGNNRWCSARTTPTAGIRLPTPQLCPPPANVTAERRALLLPASRSARRPLPRPPPPSAITTLTCIGPRLRHANAFLPLPLPPQGPASWRPRTRPSTADSPSAERSSARRRTEQAGTSGRGGAVRGVKAGRGESSRAGPGARQSPQGEAGRVCRRCNEQKAGSFETEREEERNRNSDEAVLALAVNWLLAWQCTSQLWPFPVPAAFQSCWSSRRERTEWCCALGSVCKSGVFLERECKVGMWHLATYCILPAIRGGGSDVCSQMSTGTSASVESPHVDLHNTVRAADKPCNAPATIAP